MLPPSPEALRWRERRRFLLVGVLIFTLGIWAGWLWGHAQALADSAPIVMDAAMLYRLAQCTALTAELRPGLC